MEQPSNAENATPSKVSRTWRGPGGIRVSVIGVIGVLVVVAGIVIVIATSNSAFGSGVVVAGFGVLLIDALRAR